MSDLLEYKGYYGDVNVSVEDNVIYGKVLYINDLITYEADTVSDIKKSFEEAIDDYLCFCADNNKEPDKSFKGSFNVRITPDLHKKADLEARKRKQSLNQFVSSAIENEISGRKEIVRELMYVCAPMEIVQKAFLKKIDDTNYTKIDLQSRGLTYNAWI